MLGLPRHGLSGFRVRLDTVHAIQIRASGSEPIVLEGREVFSQGHALAEKLEVFHLTVMLCEKVGAGS